MNWQDQMPGRRRSEICTRLRALLRLTAMAAARSTVNDYTDIPIQEAGNVKVRMQGLQAMLGNQAISQPVTGAAV